MSEIQEILQEKDVPLLHRAAFKEFITQGTYPRAESLLRLVQSPLSLLRDQPESFPTVQAPAEQ